MKEGNVQVHIIDEQIHPLDDVALEQAVLGLRERGSSVLAF